MSWTLFPIVMFSRPSETRMQIYSDRFYMSPKPGVRDESRVNSYWFMPYSFIHSELINSYASPTCSPPLIPLTCRLRGKFYAYCAAVMLKRRQYLLTVSISIDTAVRIFASTGSGPSFGIAQLAQAMSIRQSPAATGSVKFSAGFKARNP